MEDIVTIILFGPSGSGKTMLLHRLCLYLKHKQGFALRHGMQNVTVTQNGEMICRILDPSGVDCFIPSDVESLLPLSVTNAINSDCQRIWLFFTEFNYADPHVRYLFTKRAEWLCNHVIPPKDKFIIVVPKIDKYDLFCENKKSPYYYVYKLLCDQYPNILNVFANTNPITKLFKSYNCDMVAFSAGLFSKSADGELLYGVGDSIFPKLLWEKIMKSL